MKDAEGFGFIGGTVSERHAHTAKAEDGNRRTVFAKFSGLHLLLHWLDSFDEMHGMEARLQGARRFRLGDSK